MSIISFVNRNSGFARGFRRNRCLSEALCIYSISLRYAPTAPLIYSSLETRRATNLSTTRWMHIGKWHSFLVKRTGLHDSLKCCGVSKPSDWGRPTRVFDHMYIRCGCHTSHGHGAGDQLHAFTHAAESWSSPDVSCLGDTILDRKIR